MSPLLIAGGAVLALYLLSQSGGSSSEIKEAVILDGVDGESDEYNLTIDAMTAKVSPFDKKSMFVFYNNSESASDPALRERLTASAKEAGFKAIAHVYGPASGYPAIRTYNEGVMVEEFDGDSWDDAVAFVDEMSVAKVAGTGAIAVVGDSRCPKPGTIWSPAHGRCVPDPFSVNAHMAGMLQTRAQAPTKALTHGGRERLATQIHRLKKGALQEMREHKISYSAAKRIASDHLKMDPNYYG